MTWGHTVVPDIRTSLEATARAAWRRRQYRHELALRRVPTLDVLPASGRPCVYYLAPHQTRPSGGVRVMYRHVDLLNDLGWRAAILHARDGFRCTWFENQTPVVGPQTLQLHADDVLVIPEWYGPGLIDAPASVRKLVFNQGAYITFDMVDLASTSAGAPYADVENLVGIMTVSEDSEELLRLGFPDLPVHRCRPVVDARVFHPGESPGRRALAYVPTRRRDELHQLLHLLRAQGIDWDLVPISGMTEQQVAATLRDCAVFLSLSELDGFGLPPAEAMACGAYVIGYSGGGGREFFNPAYSAPVPDLAQFVREVTAATARPVEELAALGAKASDAILSRYSSEGLREDLRSVYRPLLAEP